jgi:hypothetical protein
LDEQPTSINDTQHRLSRSKQIFPFKNRPNIFKDRFYILLREPDLPEAVDI